MRHPLSRAALEIALKTVPNNWRADVRHDLTEERASERVSVLRTCWRAIAIGSRLRRSRSQRPARTAIFTGLLRDGVFAIRVFRRQSAVALMTVTSVAIAIGLSTAVFSLVNALTLRGEGIENSDAVFRVALNRGSNGIPWNVGDYRRLQQSTSTIDVAAFSSLGYGRLADRPDVDLEHLPSMPTVSVSGNYFEVLGARAAIGRTLSLDDDRAGAAPVVVLSYALWETTLAADPLVIGRRIWIEHIPTTVVGVAWQGFTGPTESGFPGASVWMTLTSAADRTAERERVRAKGVQDRMDAIRAQTSLTEADRDRLEILAADRTYPMPRPDQYTVSVAGRLHSNASRAQADAEVDAFVKVNLARPGATAAAQPTSRLKPIDERPPASVLGVSPSSLLIALCFLILLAGANVANLLLATAAARRRELGTRLALGATRWRIVRQLLTESVLVSVIGGVAGLVAAIWLTPALARLASFKDGFDVSPDFRVFAFATSAMVVIGIVAGLAPARFGRRADPAAALGSGRLASLGGVTGGRLRGLLVAGQTALSVVLLVMTALVTRSLVHAATTDRGYAIDHLITTQVWPSRGHLVQPTRVTAYWDGALERVRQLPGIAAASLAKDAPFDGNYGPQRLLSGEIVSRNSVDSDYFDAIGAKLLRGRPFVKDEARSGAAVAVITERVARAFWGDDSPVGSTLDRVWDTSVKPGATTTGTFRRPIGAVVVGVVAEMSDELRQSPTIYMPMDDADRKSQGITMLIRTRGDAAAMVAQVRQALAFDPDVDVHIVQLVRDGVAKALQYPTAVAVFSSIIGGSALLLAIVGLFGVTAFTVSQRRHEVGVRMALGATPSAVVRTVLRDALRPVQIGVVIGLAGAWFSGQVVRYTLYGVSEHDPIALAASVIVLVAAAGAAAFIPARHAARVDPAKVLNQS